MRRIVLAAALPLALLFARPAPAADPDPGNWPAVVEAARGETVYFDAWGGSPNINDYLTWAAGEVDRLYGVKLTQVPVDDTANVVAKVLSEKTAGRDTGGSVDLVWINGENFAAMKSAGLLAPGFATKLPNWRFVDVENQPTVLNDFTVPTGGQESPWGGAKLVFFADTARTGPIDAMPKSSVELLEWAKKNPGRFSYPAPPDFIGTTFLKQALSELIADPSVLARPVSESDFPAVTAPLWAYLDTLKPVSWRQGRDHPASYPEMKQLLADGELGIIFAFNPGEASAAIEAGELPDTVRAFTFPGGTLGNTHFVAIPYNSDNKAAAMVVADFLLSPAAQLRKEDPRYWGDPTVLSPAKLPADLREAFAKLDRGPATLSGRDLGLTLAEPHPSWTEALEAEWQKRYGG